MAKGISEISSKSKGAAVGEFEFAALAAQGSGEGALLVPKQFAFEEAFGEGGAIHLHERLVAAR